MSYSTWQDAVADYLRWTEQLTSVRAHRIGERGVRPERWVCRCGHSRPQRSESRRWGVRWLCARCGRAWPVVEWVEGIAPERRRAPMEAQRLQHADLGLALAELTLWERRVCLAWIRWRGPGRRDVGIAAFFRKAFRRSRVRWTPYRVRKLLASGGDRLERALGRRGLLA